MAGSTAVCRYFQTGYCKFKSECRNMHINEYCSDSQCSDRSCIKRHPRKCKYFVTFGSCKFATNCAYLHLSRAQEDGEIALLKEEIGKLKMQISRIQQILNYRESNSVQDANADLYTSITSPTVFAKEDSVSDIPQIDGTYESINDALTIKDNYETRECTSTSSLSTATLVSPSDLPIPTDDGTCVSCDAEYSGWEDFIARMKKSNYMCFGCFDYFPDQPWFKRSLLIEVDAQCGSYLYLKQP